MTPGALHRSGPSKAVCLRAASLLGAHLHSPAQPCAEGSWSVKTTRIAAESPRMGEGSVWPGPDPATCTGCSLSSRNIQFQRLSVSTCQTTALTLVWPVRAVTMVTHLARNSHRREQHGQELVQ